MSPVQRLATLVVGIGLFAYTSLECVVVPIIPDYLASRSLPSWFSFVLFACKPLTQLLAGPLVGGWADRSPVGPLAGGLLVLVVSACAFAFELSWPHTTPVAGAAILCGSRLLLGVASAAIMAGGLGLVAMLHDDEERGSATGNAMCGLALGALAPLWGGWAAGGSDAVTAVPFWCLGGLSAATLSVVPTLSAHMPLQLPNAPEEPSVAPISTDAAVAPRPLWRRPAVLLIGGCIALANCAASFTEPIVPLWLNGAPLRLSTGMQGVVFASATLLYLLVTPLGGNCADAPRRRRRLLQCGLLCVAAGLALVGLAPLAATADAAAPARTALPCLIGGLGLVGAGVALVDTPAMPLLASLAEACGAGCGAAGAVEATAMSLGQLIGPLLALPLNAVGSAFATGVAPAWLAVGLAPAAFATAAVCLLVAAAVPHVLRPAAAAAASDDGQASALDDALLPARSG